MATRTFVIGVALVIGGCCLNNVFLENLIVGDKASGQLLTLLQFGFIAAMSCGPRVEKSSSIIGVQLKQTTAPLWWYLALTSIFWTLSVLNNMAYDYEISQPLHMVFRSSSLAVSLLLGFVFFKKRYNTAQVLGVAVVTVGIFATTFADASFSSACGPNGCSAASATQWVDFSAMSQRKWIGVAILTSGLFLSSLLGHLQSFGYEYWGKKDEHEAM